MPQQTKWLKQKKQCLLKMEEVKNAASEAKDAAADKAAEVKDAVTK